MLSTYAQSQVCEKSSVGYSNMRSKFKTYCKEGEDEIEGID